MSDSTLDQTK